jgi:hypothetical protein
MMRTDRTRLPEAFGLRTATIAREVLLAIAPPPKTGPSAGGGWPSWLIPAYRSGGHRPTVRLLEEER